MPLQFRYATSFDYLLMFIGSFSAVLHGAALPVMFIIFGETTDSFNYYDLYKKCDFNYTVCSTIIPGLTEESVVFAFFMCILKSC